MKRLISLSLLLPLLAILFIANIPAEEEENKMVYFNVHEDLVIPSKVFEYEAACKKLKDYCVKHKIENVEWMTASMMDFRYIHINRIEKMGDLDIKYFEELTEKVGKEEMGQLWDEFDQCYTTHRNFTIALDNGLSYMPDGMEIDMVDKTYRHWQFVHYDQKDHMNMVEVAKKFKELHTAKSTPLHYRVFHSGFGAMGPYMVFVISAKDAVDLAMKQAKTRELMGEERLELLKEAFSYMTAYDEVSGSMKPELSYGSIDITTKASR